MPSFKEDEANRLWELIKVTWLQTPSDRPSSLDVRDMMKKVKHHAMDPKPASSDREQKTHASTTHPSKRSMLSVSNPCRQVIPTVQALPSSYAMPPDVSLCSSHTPTTRGDAIAHPPGSARSLLMAQIKPKHPVRTNERLAILLPRSLWKPDSMTEECDSWTCITRFSLFERRHHCRKCGGVFCQACTSQTTFLLDTTDIPSRYSPASISLNDGSLGPLVDSRVCEDCHALISSPSWAPTDLPIYSPIFRTYHYIVHQSDLGLSLNHLTTNPKGVRAGH
ncbi:hypothetical protein FRC12_005693 [Ceratobasidium sp. 428]|nr:hypothetical protein FRC12_005693 [Ceratobasidium sp. 428]